MAHLLEVCVEKHFPLCKDSEATPILTRAQVATFEIGPKKLGASDFELWTGTGHPRLEKTHLNKTFISLSGWKFDPSNVEPWTLFAQGAERKGLSVVGNRRANTVCAPAGPSGSADCMIAVGLFAPPVHGSLRWVGQWERILLFDVSWMLTHWSSGKFAKQCFKEHQTDAWGSDGVYKRRTIASLKKKGGFRQVLPQLKPYHDCN